MEEAVHDARWVERRRIFTAALVPAAAVVALWVAYAFDRVYALDLAQYGILPRTAKGLWGILVSPFVHADLEHLFNNSTPIFVLGWMLVYFYPKVSGRVVAVSWLMGGLWVWATARESYHIGASGVVYGLAAFLFTSGVIRRQRGLMTVSLLIVFLYGSMWWGMLPLVERISYESHICGAVAGVLLALVYRHVPPAHVAPPIEFTDEEDGSEPGGAMGSAPVEGDEVDDGDLAMQRSLEQEARRSEESDPFGPMWRTTTTHPTRARWLQRQQPPPGPPHEEEEQWP